MRVVPADRPDLTDHEFHFSEQPDLSEELRMLREQVRRFVEKEVVPHGEQWERDGMIPREIFRRMGALGFLGMRHEAEYGGTEMGPLASMVFAEELGRSTFGGFTSSTLVHSDMSAVHIMLRGTPEQKEKYLPAIIRGETICSIAVTEPDAGSDVAGLKTPIPRPRAAGEYPCSSSSDGRPACPLPSWRSMGGSVRTPPRSAFKMSAFPWVICLARKTAVSTALWRPSRTSASASAASAPANPQRRSS
jgi:hypothetical protein